MRRNLHLLGWFLFFYRLNFFSPIIVLYIIDLTGSYSLGMSLLAIERITILATEIPTGILSDNIGRKKTATLGALAKIIGISLIALADASSIGIAILILGLFFTGISFALFSGNNNALLYETLQNLGKSHKLHKFLGKKIDFAVHSALFISCIIGGFIAYAEGYRAVIWLSLFPSTISLFISFFFTETQVKSKQGLRALAHLKRSFKGLGKSKNNFKIFLADALESIHQAVYRMEVVFVDTLLPLWGVGMFKGFIHLTLSISFMYSGKIIEKIGYRKAAIEGHIIFSIIQIIGYLLTTVASPFIIVFSYLFKGYSQNATKILIQHSLSDKERATMDSILSMNYSLLAAFMLILMGLLVDYVGIANAAITFIVFRMIVTVPLLRNYFNNEEAKQT